MEQFGPVFNQNIGSTLPHFLVKLAGPMGQLFAYK